MPRARSRIRALTPPASTLRSLRFAGSLEPTRATTRNCRTPQPRRSSGSNPLIPKFGQHTGYHMIEVVAVERPSTRVVRIKGYSHTAHTWRDQHGVAHRALHRPAIDRDHLECMSVQMHRMRHHRAVDQFDLDALSLAQH